MLRRVRREGTGGLGIEVNARAAADADMPPKRWARRGFLRVGSLLLLGLACTWAVRALALGLPDLTGEAGTSIPSRANAAATPGRDMIRVLGAPEPHPSVGPESRVFDRFVGTWDCDYGLLGPDGTTTRFRGQVAFGWVLDGRAVQDVWWSQPPGKTSAERTMGTTLRFFDAKRKLWRVIWIAPQAGAVIQLEGGEVDGRIVLRGTDVDGSLTRWSFNDIQPNSFTWRSETSRDDGRTWLPTEEHHLHRLR